MQLADYRELHVDQPFDKIASVGMFEHVGRAQMGRHFDTVARLLRPGGLVLNHGITAGGVDNAQLGAGMGDFIEQYIFPGGELLHVSMVLQDLARASLHRMGLGQFDIDGALPHDGAKALEMLRGKGVALKDWAAEMEKTTRPYVLRAVDDRLAFREKLFIFDAGLDDRLVEIYKFMVCYQYAAAGKAQGGEHAYFYTDSKGHHRVQLVRGKETLGLADFPRKIYNQIHAEYAKKLGDIRKAEPVVDEAWARKFLMAQGQV